MERKVVLNQLAMRFAKSVIAPVNTVCLDNPDALVICNHGLVGVFIPTIEEYKNNDHLLRRLWMSRMVYSEQMLPFVIIDDGKRKDSNIKVINESFGNMLIYDNIEDTIRFINQRVDSVKGLSQKVRQGAFADYYKILDFSRSKDNMQTKKLNNQMPGGKSVGIRSWSRGSETVVMNTFVDHDQNQMFYRMQNSQSFREAMNNVFTYAMIRRYDYNRHSLFLNNWQEEQFLCVSTDYDIWGDNYYSGLYLRTLAFYGILPVNVDNENDYIKERKAFIDFIHSKRR